MLCRRAVGEGGWLGLGEEPGRGATAGSGAGCRGGRQWEENHCSRSGGGMVCSSSLGHLVGEVGSFYLEM